MIDNSGETMRLLKRAAKRIPGNPHFTTVFRWTKKGVRGVRLEATRVGGRWYTSDEAVDRFLARLNADSKSNDTKSNSEAKRIERNEQGLKEVFGD